VSLHATICRYAGVAGSIDEVMDAGRQLASALSQEPGFVVYALLDAGDAVLVSITVFEDRTELEAADQLVGSWVAQHLAASLPHLPEVVGGEVIVQRGM
jgi:quinol monooxygenase YgiN